MGERNSKKEVRSTESETEMDEIRLGEDREGWIIRGSTGRENKKKATIMEIQIMKIMIGRATEGGSAKSWNAEVVKNEVGIAAGDGREDEEKSSKHTSGGQQGSGGAKGYLACVLRMKTRPGRTRVDATGSWEDGATSGEGIVPSRRAAWRWHRL